MQNKKKRVLGIDPGIGRTGYGVVEEHNGTQKAREYGCIETKAKTEKQKRFKLIYDTIENIIRKEKPDTIAIEEVFFAKNVSTALLTAHIRGIVMLLAEQKKIPVHEYTPLQIKQALTGYGRADKTQIQKMVQMILQLKEVPKPDDTADALAIAICDLQTKQY